VAGAVICHPHPLYGGDMDNPVVVRALEICAELGLATLRFNFRGVGTSTGAHDEGKGEQDDVRTALDAVGAEPGIRTLALLGYSFGAWAGALAASRHASVTAQALIAPPLAHYAFDALGTRRIPTLVLCGTRDVYCPAPDLERLAERFSWIQSRVIDGADHFFLGKLYPLGEALREWLRDAVAGSR